ncbi:GDSL-type esterase/lipase family protein [Embleya sp. AB8]|uniref:GDSL-type esterase/lipase family protein n=1 Tax=Embleya sp. AB8 TaxID=3156304 RepID=UPI003C76F8F1
MHFVYKLGSRYLRKTSMHMRASQFARFPPPTGHVVFFGDSITEGGLWDEWFPDAAPVNRGIGGNTVADLLGRLDTAIDRPAAVFLLIGTNDLGLGETVAEVAAGMRELAARIRERAPEAPLFIQSVRPRKAGFADRIRRLNTRYRDIAADADAEYIDLWPALADADGALRAEYTRDKLHLGGAGYAAWADVLRPYVDHFVVGVRSAQSPTTGNPARVPRPTPATERKGTP